MRTNLATVLNPSRRSNDARDFETALRRKIVGQDQAIEKVAEIYQMFSGRAECAGAVQWEICCFWGRPAPARRGWWKRWPSRCSVTRGPAIKIDCAEFSALARDCQVDRLASGIPWDTARRIRC